MNSLSRIKPCQQSLSILKVFKNVLKRKLGRIDRHLVERVGSGPRLHAETQLLIDNPIDRYLINAPMLPDLKKNADGSLTIYMQKDSPGAVKESNWLPAPDGAIYMVMRIYWPKEAALNGSWKPPVVQLTK
jgi:hypothetical protein